MEISETEVIEHVKSDNTTLRYVLLGLVSILLLCASFYLGTLYKNDISTEKISAGSHDGQTALITEKREPDKPNSLDEVSEVITEPYELWLITTSFDSVFLDNSSAYRTPPDLELPADHEYFTPETLLSNTSYKDVEVLYIHMDKEYEIRDSKILPETAVIFATATHDNIEYALKIDLTTNQATALFSSSKHPTFTNTSISSVSSTNEALLFTMSTCTGCEGSLAGNAVYNVETDTYLHLGKTGVFEWLDATNFRYKTIPQGCEDYFTLPFAREIPDPVCEQKLSDAEWISSTV